MPRSSIERWLNLHLPLPPKPRLNRWSRVLLLLLLIGALSAGAVAGPATAAAEPRVLPQLRAEASANPNTTFRVIVTRLNRDRSADNALEALGGAKIKEVAAEAFVATLPGRAIAHLGANPAVKYIAPDAVMLKTAAVDRSRLATFYPQAINAAQLWSAAVPLTGAGVGVAVLDTGMTSELKDWSNASGRSRIIASVRFNSNTFSMADGHGHGTHVAGIIGGNSWFSNDVALRGKYIGVAPEANLINVKVSDDNGMSYLSDVVSAIEWVIANRQTYNIRVMNLSLVSSVAESARTSTLAAAVERAWFNGIFVVVAAGNAGPNTMQYPPANDPFVVTVGASDPQGTASPTDDALAPWSSYGTTQDGHTKPDVVAPGRYITSTLASSSCSLARNFSGRIVDTSYIWMSGTSMSAPVVAGLAALAFQAHPEWTNDQVKWLLQHTSRVLGGASPQAGQGAGQVDAAALLGYTGTPGFANQGLAINEQLSGPNGATTYTAGSTASWSTASWSTANWSAATWSTANFSTTSSATSTERGVE